MFETFKKGQLYRPAMEKRLLEFVCVCVCGHAQGSVWMQEGVCVKNEAIGITMIKWLGTALHTLSGKKEWKMLLIFCHFAVFLIFSQVKSHFLIYQHYNIL